MKKLFLLSKKAGTALLVCCLGLTVLLSACLKEPKPEPTGEVNFRFVNAVSGSSSQDYYVNGSKKTAIPLAYGDYSAYTPLVSGNNQFAFADQGATTANAVSSVYYNKIGIKGTVFYYKALNSTGADVLAAGVIFPDETEEPVSGKAKVRFIHLNRLVNKNVALTVSVQGAGQLTPAEGVSFGSVTPYYSVDAGAQLVITGTGLTIPVMNPNFVAGKIYTIWFDGASATEVNGHVIVQ